MKKPDKSIKRRRYEARKARRAVKRRLYIKLKKKIEKRLLEGVKRKFWGEYKKIIYNIRIKAPKKLLFIDNLKDSVKFINKLEFALKKNKSVFINIKEVEKIDYSAIIVLLSVMFLFKKRHINFNGNFPIDKDVRKKLVESQFFNKLLSKKPINDYFKIKKENQIYAIGRKDVKPQLSLHIILEAARTIWGENRLCKGLQRVFVELMQNTHAHASQEEVGREYWWLSVNHDKKNKKVSFVFLDYGQGIFESLFSKSKESKWYGAWEIIKKRVKHGGNAKILKMLLEGDLHMSVTGEHFRGKGLPGIKQVYDRNQISNLYVISNNVFAEIKNNNYKTINHKFNGTFLYWELNYDNLNSICNISKQKLQKNFQSLQDQGL